MTVSADAQAIVLLCSSIASSRDDPVDPLGPKGWSRLASVLEGDLAPSPGGLLGLSASEIDAALDVGPEMAQRLARLLARSGQLAFELERLQSRGIWIITIVDAGYPSRLRERLGGDAPPVLFGAGEPSTMSDGGVAIVGSRDASEEETEFATELASRAARGGTQVVSGGARGIDTAALRAVVEAGGHALAILPEGIEHRIKESSTREAVLDGRATIVSMYHPAAGFSAGAAMARNKVIYALSDVAVVVCSTASSGGTWSGAIEALGAAWVPVLAWDHPSGSEGNRELIGRGATAITLDDLDLALSPGRLSLPTREPPALAAAASAPIQGTLFSD